MSRLLRVVVLSVGVFQLEPPPVAPAVHLVADPRHVGGVRATAAAHISHAQLQPLLDEHLYSFTLVTVYPPGEHQKSYYKFLTQSDLILCCILLNLFVSICNLLLLK